MWRATNTTYPTKRGPKQVEIESEKPSFHLGIAQASSSCGLMRLMGYSFLGTYAASEGGTHLPRGCLRLLPSQRIGCSSHYSSRTTAAAPEPMVENLRILLRACPAPWMPSRIWPSGRTAGWLTVATRTCNLLTTPLEPLLH